MKNFRSAAICIASIALLNACGGGGGGGGGGSGPTPPGPAPGPTPVSVSQNVNIGNVATIPVGLNGGTTAAIVTNNFSAELILTSATYSIYGAKGAGEPQDATKAGSPVDTRLCTKVQGQGTCSLALSIPNIRSVTEGQYLVTLNFTKAGSGEKVTAKQLISYSSAVPVTEKGIQVSTMNNTLYNSPGNSTTYAVPFILTKAMTSLIATTQYNNPAFAPTITCMGKAPYAVGTSCTLYVQISQTGNVSTLVNNITISGDLAAVSLKMRSKSMMKVKAAPTGYLFNVPVTVVQNNTGNLVTSAINVIVNPANGTSPQTITLLNNGNGQIKGINVTPGTPTVVGSNTCGTLEIGDSCTFTVDATLTQNAQSSVIVNYTSNGATHSLAFNVIYILPVSAVGLDMAKSGDFNGVVVNTVSFVNVTVRNNESTTLTNITFTPLNGTSPADFTYGSGGSCLTNGTQTLAANQSCTLQIQYFPQAVGSGSLVLRQTANYVTPGGELASYTAASTTISYSAVEGEAFVYTTPNYVSYGIKADGSDTATQTFTIVNGGPLATTVTSFSLATPSVTGYTDTGEGTCSFGEGQTLGVNESCTVVAKFGPTTDTINTSAQMLAVYNTYGVPATATAFTMLDFNSTPSALVSIESITSTGGDQFYAGHPFNWTYENTPASPPLEFTITYQNTGTQAAENFNVALNTLPVGFYNIGGTCGFGESTITLEAGSTCTVSFGAVDTALSNSYAIGGELNFRFPGFSFNDANTGLNKVERPTLENASLAKVTIFNFFNNPYVGTTNWSTAATGGTNELRFYTLAEDIDQRFTFLHPEYYDYIFPGPGTGGGGTNYCIIPAGETTCSIPVTNLPGTIPGTVYFLYLVSPNSIPGSGVQLSGSITFID
jgi:hypothetical protein